MDKKKHFWKKVVMMFFALVVAVLGSLPFLLWGDKIKEMSSIGYLGLFISCFLTNATVFLPASAIAFTVSAATVLEPVICCIVGGFGTALGELISFFCGIAGKKVVEQSTIMMRIADYVHKYGFWTVLLFAFLPFPIFDFVGITAGASRMPFAKYLCACILGKTAKMFCYVYLFKMFLP